MKISYSRFLTFLNRFWSGYYGNNGIGKAFCQEFNLADEFLLAEEGFSEHTDHILHNYIEDY